MGCNVNCVVLGGNLTRDPESRAAGSATVVRFGIANNRKFSTASGEKREEVAFAEVEAWGKTGETIAKHFVKGKPIVVVGRWKTEQWEQDGKKESRTRLVCEQFHFADGPKGDEPAPAPARAGGKAKAAPAGGVPDDDIPFLPD